LVPEHVIDLAGLVMAVGIGTGMAAGTSEFSELFEAMSSWRTPRHEVVHLCQCFLHMSI